MDALNGSILGREGVLFAGMLSVLLLTAILVLVLRTKILPTCWNCGHRSVRRSHSHGPMDIPALACFLHPHRCEKCRQRFYCFESRRVPRHVNSRSMAAGKS